MSKTVKIIFLVIVAAVLLALIVGIVWFVQKGKSTRFFTFGNVDLFSRATNPMEEMPDISPIKESSNVFAKTETNPYSYAYENPF